MSSRFFAIAVASAALSVLAHGQSNVRPLPRTAMATDLALFLASALPHGAGPAPARAVTTGAPSPSGAEPVSPEQDPVVEMELYGRTRSATGFDAAPGSMGYERAGWDAHIGLPTGSRSSFTVNLHTEATFYRFGGASALVPGANAPFNDTYETALGATLVNARSARTSYFTGFEVMLSGEDNASFGGSASVAGLGGMRYEPRPDLSFSFGLAARTRLEDDPWLYPFLGFDWSVNDWLRLRAEGPRVRASAELSERWSLYGEAAYELRQYRLNDSNALPGGVARDEEIDVGLGLEWRPTPETRLTLSGGVTAWQELTFLDARGDLVSEDEARPGFFVGLALQFGFGSGPGGAWHRRALP